MIRITAGARHFPHDVATLVRSHFDGAMVLWDGIHVGNVQINRKCDGDIVGLELVIDETKLPTAPTDRRVRNE